MPKSPIKTSKIYFTPNQVAELLRVAPVTVRRWALEGKLSFTTTPGGHRRFLKSDIEKFANAHGLSINSDSSTHFRILIVDNNRELAAYLSELLENLEEVEAVKVAYDGFETGLLVSEFNPNIVLLDLKMPGLDGFETCHRIKHNSATKNIRVIAMTGYPSAENVSRILSEGAEQCLSKPIRAPELLRVLGISDVD